MSYIEQSEIEIIAGCKIFDREAQKRLYKLYHGKMNSISFRYTSSYDDAKDIVHDSFILVFEKILNYTGTGSLEGWIRRIVVNKSIDFLNRKNRLHTTVTDQEQSALNDLNSLTEHNRIEDERNLDSIYTSGLTKEEILEAIDSLKDNYKIVFNLNVIDGFSHKSIGEILNIKEELSRIRLKRARTILQSILLGMAEAKKLKEINSQGNEKSVR